MAHVVTAASLATGASLSAAPASATGTLRTVILGQAAACAAVTTQMVKGARGVQPDTLGTQHLAPGSTAGPAPVLRGPALPATLLPPATKTAAPNRSSATAALATQVPAVMSVPLGTMETLCRVDVAYPASAMITSM